MPFKRIWQSCPVSKGGDYVESLSCLRHVWRMWTFRLYCHTRIFRSCCTAQRGTATDVVNSCLLSSTPSSSHPLRETLMAGHSEGTTAVSLWWRGNQRTDYRFFFTMIWICFVSPENILKLNNCGTVRVETLCCLDMQPSGLDLGKVFRWDPHNWILVAVTENRVGWRCISMLKPSPSKCKALELIPKLGRNHEGKARGCTQFPYLLQVVPCIFLGLLSMRSHSTLEQKDKTKKNPFLFQPLPSLCHCATEHL